MITIQQFGTEVMQGNPRNFYAFCGTEYGVKMKYIKILTKHYSGRKVESDSIESILKMMSVKRILPLQPTLYVVRYDDDFLKVLDKQASKLKKVNIVGTIVVLYDTETALYRCDKFIPDNLVEFEPVDKRFVFKYLKSDFPELEDVVIGNVLDVVKDYISAYNICFSLDNVDRNVRVCLDKEEIRRTFCSDQSINIDLIKYGIAARDARYCFNIIAQYDGTADSIIYPMLSALLDIEKGLTYKKGNSYVTKHLQAWNIFDVQQMFQNLYDLLIKSRESGSIDLLRGIECVITSMSYSPIMKIAV